VSGVNFAKLPRSPAYRRVERLLDDGCGVVLDGGVATELEPVRRAHPELDREPWGSWALRRAPADVLAVHERYVAAGCDVISTNTWSLIEVVEADTSPPRRTGLPGWSELARDAIRLARRATAGAARGDRCAVAFAINDDVSRPGARSIIEVLTWVFDEDPPDLVLLETLSRFPDELTLEAIDILLDSGVPVWVSFRRCRYGFCSAIGSHRDPDDEPRFRDAIDELERRGVGAVLLNCVPPDELTGAISALRPRVSLPLGVYPSLGRATADSWQFDDEITPERYAQLAIGWRHEGAQIIGGCCGVAAEHVAAVAALVRRMDRGVSTTFR
jgi:S-methylmethionine-dependent homocysteine/selenocysteine methylase